MIQSASQFTHRQIKASLVSMTAAALIMSGCAHRLSPVALSPQADPTQELTSFTTAFESARSKGVDVLAPTHFSKAESYLEQARKRNTGNIKGTKILESIAYGRAYLKEAEQRAEKVDKEIAGVSEAREMALKAGARQVSQLLDKADQRLVDVTERLEKGENVSVDSRNFLHQTYSDLELTALKHAKLSEARNLMILSERLGAPQYTPRTYARTLQAVMNAEKTIEANRRSEDIVDKAAQEATAQAKFLNRIINTTLSAKRRSPESVALELDSKVVALTKGQQHLKQIASESLDRQKTLGQMEDQVKTLKQQTEIDNLMLEAQQRFDANEAEVYRQGRNLIVKMKAMHFPVGMATLPSSTFSTLHKLKELIDESDAQSITIEGHADGTGSAGFNRELSVARAQSVADYLSQENSLERDQIQISGAGYERPLASNKTKRGREQNRRVDVVLHF